MYPVRFGPTDGTALAFNATALAILPYEQPLDRIGSGLEIERASRKGVQQYTIGDLSGGLLVEANDILNISNILRYAYNQGLVTRVPGFLGLPEVVTNQAAITNDENISAFVAANKRVHADTTSVGSAVGDQLFFAAGTRFFQLNTATGAVSVASCNVDAAGASSTLPGIVTCMSELTVGGARVLAIALKDYGVVYTTDPDAATVVFTILVDGASDSYVYAMRYLQTIGPGVNIFCGNADGTNGFWWELGSASAPFTVKEAVLNDTAGDFNPDAIQQTTGLLNPTLGFSGVKVISGADVWTNPGNILASDDSRATYSNNQVNTTPSLYAGGFDLSSVIPTNIVTGILVSVEQRVAAAGDQYFLQEVYVVIGGTRVGVNLATYTDVSSTTDAVTTYGSTSAGPFNLTGSDLQQGLLVELVYNHEAANVDQIEVDHIQVNIGHKTPGAMTTLPLGGWMLERDNTKPNRITVAVPTADEEITVLLPRELWAVDFAWDSSGARPVMAISQPNEGVFNTHHAVPWLGGTLLCGDNVTGPATLLKAIDKNGRLITYDFPKAYGTYTPKINRLMPMSDWAVLEVVMYNSSGTVVDLQNWFLNSQNGRIYTDTPLTTLTDNGSANMTIGSAPLAWSTVSINPLLNYNYVVYPFSTDTAVRRERFHTDLSADPRLDNPSWVKQMSFNSSGVENTRMQIRLPRMNFGPEEALKAITQINALSTQLDDDTTYGSALLEIDTGGDTALGTPEVTNVFDSALEVYQYPDGRPYVSMIIRISLGHQAGTAEQPNGLGFVLTTKQKWPRINLIRVTTDKAHLGKYRNIAGFLAAIKVLELVNPVQQLHTGITGEVLVSLQAITDINGQPVGYLDVESTEAFNLVFLETVGVTS